MEIQKTKLGRIILFIKKFQFLRPDFLAAAKLVPDSLNVNAWEKFQVD